MKRLINLAHYDGVLDWFRPPHKDLEPFLHDHGLDGVELLLFGEEVTIPKRVVGGVHLRTWSYWLDFWFGNEERLLDNFLTRENVAEVYGGEDRGALISWYRKEFAMVRSLGARYMVFHVSDIDLHELYTGDYHYSDLEVIDATIELINESFQEDSEVMLLFENMWGPGMRYDDLSLVQRLFEGVRYKNKGLIMDLSHYAIAKGGISSEVLLYEEIRDMVSSEPKWKDYFKGIHISEAIPRDALSGIRKAAEGISPLYPMDLDSRFNHNMTQVGRMDTHRPFSHRCITSILTLLSPDFVVYEFIAKDREELSRWITLQNSYLEG